MRLSWDLKNPENLGYNVLFGLPAKLQGILVLIFDQVMTFKEVLHFHIFVFFKPHVKPHSAT